MSMERLVMRQIKEVLRLKLECKLSNSKVAVGCNISRETVRKYLIRAADANLSWPLPVADIPHRLMHFLLFIF